MRRILVPVSSCSMHPQSVDGGPAGKWTQCVQVPIWVKSLRNLTLMTELFRRLCSYPQHITLRLVERSRVRKLQLLAHQYMVPTQVEFHIGDPPPPGSSPGLPGQLRRLGWDRRLGSPQLCLWQVSLSSWDMFSRHSCVSLSNNENTGFKARELKSGHVDAIGSYLRITFHRNHINRYNKYNQVMRFYFLEPTF